MTLSLASPSWFAKTPCYQEGNSFYFVMCQPEVYWLSKQRILFFCGWQNLKIKRLVSKFVHSWHKGSLPVLFDNIFQYASNVHHYNTRYTAKKNLYKPSVRTNIGKQSISFMATNIWKDLPTYLKNLSVFTFPKKIKHFLLSEQQTK